MAIVNSGQQAAQSLIRLRELAVQVLAQVYNTKDTLDEAMGQVLSQASAKTFLDFDRAWIFEICSGVLRYRGRIDYIIDTYSLKKKPTGEIRRFLQTGVFQLLAQDVASALAVSETVQAIRKCDGEAPSKFANAVLRKVADSRENWRNWKVTEQSSFDEQLAWSSLPEWLFKKLRKERGSSWVYAFSEAVLTRPQVWYRTGDEPMLLADGYRGNEPLGYVQDISNQLLVEDVKKFMKEHFKGVPKILDLCSAPGGKALGLAGSGYSVIATDLDEDRLGRVRENSARLKLQDKISILPHAEVWDSDEKYDLIWVDAPCSSTGIIRRHPEIKWNRTYSDVEKLVLKQEELMVWAGKHLTDQGVLIYSTCSLLQVENAVPADFWGKVLERKEWVPQSEPKGDGIQSVFIVKSGI